MSASHPAEAGRDCGGWRWGVLQGGLDKFLGEQGDCGDLCEVAAGRVEGVALTSKGELFWPSCLEVDEQNRGNSTGGLLPDQAHQLT